ncbi:hypothetical protein SXANM310S_02571 [Streptomyces xanthochromogenes]
MPSSEPGTPEVLLLGRHMNDEHLVAGLATALRAGAFTADAVALEARKAAEADDLPSSPPVSGHPPGQSRLPRSQVTFLADWRMSRRRPTLGRCPRWPATTSCYDTAAQAVRPPAREKPTGPLAGKTVVVSGTMTGPLASYDRVAMTQLIRDAGGKPGRDVISKTHLLVVGERAGSKVSKTEKHSIAVFREEEFAVLVAEFTS